MEKWELISVKLIPASARDLARVGSYLRSFATTLRGPWGIWSISFSRRTLAEKDRRYVSRPPNRKWGNPAENAPVGKCAGFTYDRSFTVAAIIFQPPGSILRNSRAVCR